MNNKEVCTKYKATIHQVSIDKELYEQLSQYCKLPHIRRTTRQQISLIIDEFLKSEMLKHHHLQSK